MSKLKTFIIAGIMMVGASTLSAETPKTYTSDYGFEQERMIIDDGEIYLVSSFDNKDYVCVYNAYGTRLWEVAFHAKILSWEVTAGYVVVFSKHRDGHKTYLTCLDRVTGQVLWERP